MAYLWMAIGLVVLTVGAEALIRGAVRLAAAAGLPSLVIGLTVVAFGTGAPEFAVSMKAGLAGQVDISVGNVVGSNVINVLLILGLSALIAPLVASRQLVKLDVPVLIGVSLLMWLFASDGSFSRLEGGLMVLCMVGYTTWLIWLGRRQSSAESKQRKPDDPVPPRPGLAGLLAGVLMVAIGLVGLVLGAQWMVVGATDIARMLGISDLLVGLTIVAAGTSLPEVATSVIASIRGQRDIAIGNVVGSNIFNILAVVGSTAAISAEGIAVAPAALNFDLPVMVAVTVACLPIFFTGGRIARWEGVLFLGYYIAYVAFLVFAATKHEALQPFSMIMAWFAIPLTVLGLLISVVVYLRIPRDKRVVPPQ